jgi:uncharacterized membrane protein
MSEPTNHLFALAFDDEYKADEARIELRRMGAEGLINLEETAVVVVGVDCKPKITQDVDVTSARRTEGHWLGIAAALVTGVQPLILVGTAAGQVLGVLTDHGITQRVMKPIADTLTPGTSALFAYGTAVHEEDRARVAERLGRFGGKLVYTTVAPELKETLSAMLEQPSTSAASAPAPGTGA